MARLLFSLRGVPEDEAAEVRELLNDHAIAFYETPPGNWGISLPALWLYDDAQLEEALTLLANYQRNRATTQKNLYRQLKKEGKTSTFLGNMIERPGRFILHLSFLAMILYASIKLIDEFGG